MLFFNMKQLKVSLTSKQSKMKNANIVDKLISIKLQLSELGIEYLETQMPIALSDVGRTLKPFTSISSTIDLSIKKLSSDVVPGCIPKSNTLRP